MNKSRFDAAQVKRAAAIVRILNNKERMRMINLLEGTAQMRPLDFVEAMGLLPNRVQLHLSMLSDYGLIRRKVVTRKEVYYSLYTDRIIQVADGVRIIAIRNPKEYTTFVRFGTVA